MRGATGDDRAVARTLRSDLSAFGARIGKTVPGWVGGAMAGLQSALLSAGAVIAVALATAANSPPPDGTAGVDWEAAASVGTRVWLLGHGVIAGDAQTPVGLVPLGLTAVFIFLSAGLARRFGVPTTGSWLAFTATYASIVVAVSSAMHADLIDPHAGLRAGIVGAIVAGGGAGAGLWRAGWRPGASWLRVPALLTEGLRLGVAVVLGVWACGALAFVVWTLAGWSDIGAVAGSLDADPIGSLTLAIGEALYAPTLAVWGMAWIAGPGFSVGVGTEYAPGHLSTAPLPSVPILGSLPHAAGGLLVLAPLVIAAIAGAARSIARRREKRGGAGVDVLAVLTVALGAGVLAAASRGSIGGGTFARVGPEPVAMAVWIGILTAVGFGAVALVSRLRSSTTRTDEATEESRSASPGSERSPHPRGSSGMPPSRKR